MDVARAGFLPTLDARLAAGGARTNNSSTRARTGRGHNSVNLWRGESSLTMSQLLFDGEATENAFSLAKAQADASEFRVLDASEQIGLRAVIAYLDVSRTRPSERRSSARRGRGLATSSPLGMKRGSQYGPVSIPDRDRLHADLTGPSYAFDSNTRLKLEKKEDMKRRGIRSPDEGDALALTFASPVASPEPVLDRYAEAYRRQKRRMYSAWSA